MARGMGSQPSSTIPVLPSSKRERKLGKDESFSPLAPCTVPCNMRAGGPRSQATAWSGFPVPGVFRRIGTEQVEIPYYSQRC